MIFAKTSIPSGTTEEPTIICPEEKLGFIVGIGVGVGGIGVGVGVGIVSMVKSTVLLKQLETGQPFTGEGSKVIESFDFIPATYTSKVVLSGTPGPIST